MKIYYSEIYKGKWTYYSIEHDKRHLFWKDHSNAKEISRKEYEEMMKFALAQKEQIENNG